MRSKTPIMGWSSWNNFRTKISEHLIMEQADAIVCSGLNAAGYSYINIDDGYFGGRREDGSLFEDKNIFPSGMKALADYIHSKGLKAGIYSEAGCNTCASTAKADNYDPRGRGAGLYGHDREDIELFLKKWSYDFLKVDWCGGKRMRLDPERRYTEISAVIREVAPDALYNVCRWKFPGKWVVDIADSWRISGDILPEFGPVFKSGTILNIIEKNSGLAMYAGPGKFNDMDMLQVGRGMSLHEDRAHFSMWCMMASPLLAGNDLRNMSRETVKILTNKDLIAINQDPLGCQARRIKKRFGIQIWKKDLANGSCALAVLNTGSHEKQISLNPADWFDCEKIKECWSGELYSVEKLLSVSLEKHQIAVFVEG